MHQNRKRQVDRCMLSCDINVQQTKPKKKVCNAKAYAMKLG